ncbi:hypothetical protein C0J52_09165 [Blattella germanica]|nr:hypothetical protein C0J52_09165 [Blattella germanica]
MLTQEMIEKIAKKGSTIKINFLRSSKDIQNWKNKEYRNKKIDELPGSAQNRLLIKNGKIVNEDGMVDGDVYVEDGIINGPKLSAVDLKEMYFTEQQKSSCELDYHVTNSMINVKPQFPIIYLMAFIKPPQLGPPYQQEVGRSPIYVI